MLKINIIKNIRNYAKGQRANRIINKTIKKACSTPEFKEIQTPSQIEEFMGNLFDSLTEKLRAKIKTKKPINEVDWYTNKQDPHLGYKRYTLDLGNKFDHVIILDNRSFRPENSSISHEYRNTKDCFLGIKTPHNLEETPTKEFFGNNTNLAQGDFFRIKNNGKTIQTTRVSK